MLGAALNCRVEGFRAVAARHFRGFIPSNGSKGCPPGFVSRNSRNWSRTAASASASASALPARVSCASGISGARTFSSSTAGYRIDVSDYGDGALSDGKIDSLLRERERCRVKSRFRHADSIKLHLEERGVVINDRTRTWVNKASGSAGKMPKSRERAPRRMSRQEKVYGRRIDDGDLQTKEEADFFALKGASALPPSALGFLHEKRGSLGSLEFQKYLNSIIITDLKRNKRYLKTMQIFRTFRDDFNGVLYASTLKRLNACVPLAQHYEFVGTRHFADFMAGLVSLMIEDCESFEPRQIAAIMTALVEMKMAGDPDRSAWSDASNSSLLQVCNIVGRRDVYTKVVEEGRSGEVAAVVWAFGKLGYPRSHDMIFYAAFNAKLWLDIDADRSTDSKSVALFLEGCSNLNLRPDAVCRWINIEAPWFFDDSQMKKQMKNVVSVAYSLARMNDEETSCLLNSFFLVVNDYKINKVKKSADFHDLCKMMWSLSISSSFDPASSQVGVLWSTIIDLWNAEKQGYLVKGYGGKMRVIHDAKHMAHHMQKSSTHKIAKTRFDVVVSSTGGRSAVLHPRKGEERLVKESLAMLAQAYAMAENYLPLEVAPAEMYCKLRRSAVRAVRSFFFLFFFLLRRPSNAATPAN